MAAITKQRLMHTSLRDSHELLDRKGRSSHGSREERAHSSQPCLQLIPIDFTIHERMCQIPIHWTVLELSLQLYRLLPA